MIKLGCHVGMSGKEMFLGSVKEALSYGANTFMVYTGAPQNTRRKEIDQLNIPAAVTRETGCGCADASTITAVVSGTGFTATNVAMTVVKE